jgi:hypothetical protein
MLVRKIFAIYFGNSIKQINAICGHMCRNFGASVLHYSALNEKGTLNLEAN